MKEIIVWDEYIEANIKVRLSPLTVSRSTADLLIAANERLADTFDGDHGIWFIQGNYLVSVQFDCAFLIVAKPNVYVRDMVFSPFFLRRYRAIMAKYKVPADEYQANPFFVILSFEKCSVNAASRLINELKNLGIPEGMIQKYNHCAFEDQSCTVWGGYFSAMFRGFSDYGYYAW